MSSRRFHGLLYAGLLSVPLLAGCSTQESSGDGGSSPICTAGAKRCEGGNVEVCNPDGRGWAFYRDCEGGPCTGGACGVGEGEGEGEGPAEGEGEGPAEGEGEGPVDLCLDVVCQGNQTCNPQSGACQEPAFCDLDLDCLGDRICWSARCDDPCRGNDDCVGTRRCDLDTGRCMEPAFCVVPDDCDPGRACQDGRCVPSCEADGDCPGRQTCSLDARRCVEPPRCAQDVDCLGPRVCDGRLCAEACVENQMCGGAQTCNVATGHCRSAAICASDDDCVGLATCDGGACFLPECDESWECDGTCIDRRCEAGVATECGPAAPCPGALVCAPLGACVAEGACSRDDQCPAAAPVCDAANGVCLGCHTSSNCAAAERCFEGMCLLMGRCEGDGDCPGTRVCEAGSCSTGGACQDDALEGANPTPILMARTYATLVLCDGDADEYRYELPAGEGVRFVLRHAAADGDLALSVRSTGAGAALLGRSDARLGVEAVGVDPAEAPRVLRVQIDGRPGFDTPYRLSVEQQGAAYCAPDAYEGLLGNNDAAHAARVGPGAHDHVLCPGDEDWFSVHVPAGVRIVARATPADFAGSVRISLLRPNGAELAVGGPVGPAMLLNAEVHEAGRYLVRVRPVQQDAHIGVRLELGAEPLGGARDDACPGHSLLAREPWLLPLALPARRFPTTCGVAGGVDHVGSFNLPTAAFVTLRFVDDEGGSTLALFRDCEDPASERACGADDEVTLERVPLEAGPWSVVAVTAPGGRAAVLLSVEAQCVAQGDCPAGHVCETGLCVLACQGDGDCPGRQTCDQTGRCVEAAGCLADDDCAGRRVCEHLECLLPECEIHAECAEACVDRLCADGVPAQCAGAVDCPGDQVCSELGTCVLDGACQQDADCPGGVPRCDLGRHVCVGCRGNADCAAAELCQDGRCSYRGFCGADQDCPGTRTCAVEAQCAAQGVCECEPADGCADDLLTGLDEPAELQHRAYSGLVLCDGTTDLFVTRVPRESALRVVVRHEQDAGDLSLSLRNLATHDELAAADGHDGVDVAALGAAAFQRDLEVVVQGRPGFSTPYTISLEREPAEFCPPDPLEGPLGNDDPAHATPVGLGDLVHQLCPADEDHFALHLAAGVRLVATATPEGADPADLRVTLRDPNGAELAVGQVEDGAVVASADLAVTGFSTVGVSFVDPAATVPVALRLEAVAAEQALTLACGDAEVLIPGAPQQLEATLQVRRFPLGCGIGWGGDYLATFELEEPATVRVEVVDNAQATTVSLRSDCEDMSSELACGLGVQTPVEDIDLVAGPYWVAVETTDDPPPPIVITIVE